MIRLPRRPIAAALLGLALAGGTTSITAGAAQADAGPRLGDQCVGADIGRKAVTATGTRIMCDEYRWVIDRGQRPSHSWGEQQR